MCAFWCDKLTLPKLYGESMFALRGTVHIISFLLYLSAYCNVKNNHVGGPHKTQVFYYETRRRNWLWTNIVKSYDRISNHKGLWQTFTEENSFSNVI